MYNFAADADCRHGACPGIVQNVNVVCHEIFEKTEKIMIVKVVSISGLQCRSLMCMKCVVSSSCQSKVVHSTLKSLTGVTQWLIAVSRFTAHA